MPAEHELFIDGRRTPAADDRIYETLEPGVGAPWATVSAASPADVDRAVAAASRSFSDRRWRDKTMAERAEVMCNVAEQVQERMDEFAMAEMRDAGTTLRRAYTADISNTAETLTNFADMACELDHERIEHNEMPEPTAHVISNEPYGVVGAIVPFNFPLAGAAWKVAPALMAGNSVVLKPSPLTPVSALMLAELFHECGLPDGVLNVVAGPDHALGAAIVDHRDVRLMTFTGSPEVGKKVMAGCVPHLRPLLLELGGKSPNLILHDANLEIAARGALFGAFFHTGQVCMSGSRILVDRRIHDEFVSRLVELCEHLTLGSPLDPMTTIGPLVSEAQRLRAEKYVGIAQEEGAHLAWGGGRPDDLGDGFFYRPAVFTGVDNDMRIAREEVFGPVVTVIPYDSEDEAIRIANDTEYGLSGAIWSADADRALSLAKRIDAGTIWMNDYHILSPRYPFGGYKHSGFGRELGPEGLRAYQQTKHIHCAPNSTPADKYHFNLVLGEAHLE